MTRHPLDLVSLTAGLVFVAIGVAFGVLGVDAVDLDWRWVPPLALIVAGVVVLLSARRTQPDPPQDASVADGTDDRQGPDGGTDDRQAPDGGTGA